LADTGESDSPWNFYAAKAGHISIVDILLQRRIDITAADVGYALQSAAEGGHTNIVDILDILDICPYRFISALLRAADKGHTSSVDILLKRHSYMASYKVGMTLFFASIGGKSSTFILLLQRLIYINVRYFGKNLIMKIIMMIRTEDSDADDYFDAPIPI
jgi:hypothetical protein